MAFSGQREREGALLIFEQLAEQYVANARDRLGVSGTATELHRLLDEITSDVYGQEFAYCGRTHTVI